MTAPSTSVKYYTSAMSGAPQTNNTAGSLIALLDACLVNGFGLKTADSVVVASGIATLTVAAGVGFADHAVVLVAGATPSGLNGEKRILTKNTNTITFDATGISDQTASGTITVKLAPAGWEKQYSGTNLAAYRSADVASTRNVLRVDDTAANYATVQGYTAMSDINTGTDPYPSTGTTRVWCRSKANSTNYPWVLVADGKTLYYWMATYSTDLASNPNGWATTFGDTVPFKSGDPYAAVIQVAEQDYGDGGSGNQSFGRSMSGLQYYVGAYAPRGPSGLGTYVVQCPIGEGPIAYGSDQWSGMGQITYPSTVDQSLMLAPYIYMEGNRCYRSRARGALHCHQDNRSIFTSGSMIDGTGVYLGRKLLGLRAGCDPSGSGAAGAFWLDITGPWA